MVEILTLYSNETKGKIDETNRDCKIIIGRILLYDRDEAFGVFRYRSMPVCEQMPLDFEFYTNLILNILISYAFDKF